MKRLDVRRTQNEGSRTSRTSADELRQSRGRSGQGIRLGKNVVVVCFAVVSLATLVVPWSRNGSTVRSGYALAHALETTGLVTGPFERALYDALVLLPVFVGLICAVTVLGRSRLAALLAMLEGVTVLSAAAVVFIEFHGIREIGPWLGVVVGGATATGSAIVLVERGQQRVRHT
jgi:hypothetical protein